MALALALGHGARRPAHDLGAEYAANPGFDSDTVWIKGNGWTIAGGVATHAAGQQGALRLVFPVVAGARYRCTFTVTAWSAGNVRARFSGGGLTDGTNRAAVGTYTEDLVAAVGCTEFSLLGEIAFAGSVDNVSVRRVG